ncbi:uncharacterized protein LOC126699648 isoform X2 [Quercus robur]|uniref:uncharacterized protein LOC126699648 isoform X2 n=1 Tax=Quercus robur TaxID=38942 RepID=UPI002161C211|nr:uncharacterized protein LOC126699648 isoform X2 [Quercus robur]XP_050253554.1 uncharacterized protein LOC126699648 isoform X2 [Quercus robur]
MVQEQCRVVVDLQQEKLLEELLLGLLPRKSLRPLQEPRCVYFVELQAQTLSLSCFFMITRTFCVDTLTELQRLYDELVASADACRLDRYLASEKAGRSRWLWPRFIPQSSYSPVKGLHLFGGVGTGKTMFMDLFFDQFDLQNIGYKNIDARGLITGFQFLQAYYPECLAKCFILHMSRFFVSVWRMVSRFLEKATLEKIVIVTNEDERQDFIKEVGEEVLPKEYGGRAKLVAIQDVVLAPLEG